MQYRDTKRSTLRPRSRTTRRGVATIVDADAEVTTFGAPPVADDAHPEPAVSSRPTLRNVTSPDLEVTLTRTGPRGRGPRGEFSIPSARGVPADVVSGSIERRSPTTPPRRRRTSIQAVESVHLAVATKREITVIVQDQTITLSRTDALALAQIILTAFE